MRKRLGRRLLRARREPGPAPPATSLAVAILPAKAGRGAKSVTRACLLPGPRPKPRVGARTIRPAPTLTQKAPAGAPITPRAADAAERDGRRQRARTRAAGPTPTMGPGVIPGIPSASRLRAGARDEAKPTSAALRSVPEAAAAAFLTEAGRAPRAKPRQEPVVRLPVSGAPPLRKRTR